MAPVQYVVRLAEPLTIVALSKAKLVRLIKYMQTPPSASFYDRWNLLQHPNLYFFSYPNDDFAVMRVI